MPTENECVDIILDTFDNSKIPERFVKNSKLPCCSDNHPDDNMIREGNRIYQIVVHKDNEWRIKSQVCIECSVRDIVKDIDDTFAVIEGLVKKEDEELIFKDAKVWDILEKSP